MEFSQTLTPARLVRRYKRFLADVTLEDGREITVSVPNTGSMLGLVSPGERVWLSYSDSPTRKYPYRLELVEADNTLVGVNTSLPNRIGEEAIKNGLIPELSGYKTILREQRYGENSRIDLLLQDDDKPDTFVEIKNVHYMREPGLAEFPDTVTTRGAKHLGELCEVVKQGKRGVMLFVIQRADCNRFAICGDLDPNYGQQFAIARQCGVEAYAIRCKVDLTAITATAPVDIME